MSTNMYYLFNSGKQKAEYNLQRLKIFTKHFPFTMQPLTLTCGLWTKDEGKT